MYKVYKDSPGLVSGNLPGKLSGNCVKKTVKTQTAPYLGRMTEAGKDGMAQVAAMQVLLCLAFGQMFLLTTDSLLSIIIYH